MLETLNHEGFYYGLYRSLKLWVRFILVLLYFISLESTVKNILFFLFVICAFINAILLHRLAKKRAEPGNKLVLHFDPD